MKNPVYYLLIILTILTACNKNEENSNWTEEDQAYYEHILELQNQGTDNFYVWLDIMDSLEAVDQLQQFFLGDTAVVSAVVGSQGIAIDYKNGMRGGIMLNPEDFYGEDKSMPAGGHTSDKLPGELKSIVNNSKMIFLNPSNWERTELTDMIIPKNTEDLERVGYELKKVYKDRDATLDRFCELGGYGIIRIYSHGWAHPTKWDVVETYLQTGESVSNGTTRKYGDDIKEGKIAIFNVKNVNSQLDPSPVYFISKDFITSHNDFSKDTVFFYGGFCFSFLGTWPLIEESFAKGTYMGFSWRVRTNFNCNLGTAAIEYLSDTAGANPKTAGQYMAEPNPVKEKWDDGDNVMCRLRYSGDADLTLWTKTQVTTSPVTGIDSVSATCGGTVTASASTVIEARGVCWSMYTNPSVSDNLTTNGSGPGSFTSELEGLTPGTPYYVRAYATIKNGQTIYGNEVSFTTDGGGLYIGKEYGGGRIFYIDNTMQHGLIAAETDQSNGAPWGCPGVEVGGTWSDIGYGQANTSAILAACGSAGIAARICDDLVLNGLSDWYLPSFYELNYLFLYNQQIGGFSATEYWTSSEWDENQAVTWDFSTGNNAIRPKDYSSAHVRAIRSF